MASSSFDFKSLQPIRLTGTIRHLGLWLTSGCGDLRYTRHLDDDHKESKLNHDVAIYFVHGTCDRRNSFSLCAKRLLDSLPEEVKTVHLTAFDNRAHGKSIDSFAIQLKNKIVLNKHKNVILIGHSRGCLVSSYFAEYLAAANGVNVNAVINVCGPFGGSKLALPPLSWFSKSVKQMQIDSPFLAELGDTIKTSENPYYYFAASEDNLVKPINACIKEHKDHLIELDRHGHLSILGSKRLVGHLNNLIQQVVAQSKPTPVQPTVTSSLALS